MITTAQCNKRKYSAYTLMELLVVMGIFMILAGMSLSSFGGLQNTVKMNEYMLNMEQNIRLVQRSAMLLERDVDERWLYGLGVDFTETAVDETVGKYRVFKWCSPFTDYGDIKTTSDFPNYDPGVGDITSENGGLPNTQYEGTSCSVSGDLFNELIPLAGMDISYSPPKSVVSFDTNVRYILFESVSGKAFFYNAAGELMNYNSNGVPLSDDVNFEITVTPNRGAEPRKLVVDNLSGRISTEIL
jgi:type II secretory pathway pseudopilin PulG